MNGIDPFWRKLMVLYGMVDVDPVEIVTEAAEAL